MTPEEAAVIEAAQELTRSHLLDAASGNPDYYLPVNLLEAIKALEKARRAEWRSRTWADVRQGDSIRLPHAPDAPAIVETITFRPWHVSPASARTRNPIAREWADVAVRLINVPQLLTFQPDAPVEIRLDSETYNAMMMLGGWENRL